MSNDPGPGPDGPASPDQSGPPPKKGKRGLIAGLSIAGVVVVVLVVFAGVLVFGGDDIDDLPAPKTLGRDPVPAEKSITKKPANCGISKATLKALAPRAPLSGVHGDCAWPSFDGDDSRELSVSYAQGLDPGKTSRVASAISTFQRKTFRNVLLPDAVFKPMTGLGDDAAYTVAPGANGAGVEAWVVFRVADVVTEVRYQKLGGKPAAMETFRRGAFRAAAEAARGLGVTADPAVAQVPKSTTAPVALPGDVCKLVPDDLMKTLSGDHDERESNSFPRQRESLPQDPFPPASTSSCRTQFNLLGKGWSLETYVTVPATPGSDTAVKREYLAWHYEARAERPATGGRYFRALPGLGDQAFISYRDGTREGGLTMTNAALVVIRSRTALITVAFGDDRGDSELTRQQTINGAYAVAQKVAVGVK